MLRRVLPRIECEASTQNYGRYAIGPMDRGYGVTLGTALRRVLLASIPGAAISSVRVSGVSHEFSTIPGAKEDMMRLILNLKRVRAVSHSDEPVRMRVAAKGKSVITAGDIEAPAEVEIVNPELQILTLDTLESDLELEMTLDQGVGYSPSEERPTKTIGEIPVDAIYSPITKVRTSVEPTRIEQITNYDLLKLDIWTDGTIRPADALSQAAQVLMQHLTPVAEFSGDEVAVESVEEAEEVPSEADATPIEELDLAMRAYNCLKRAGITMVGEVLERLERGPSEMLAIRNFGEKSLSELVDKLQEKGFLADDYDLSN